MGTASIYIGKKNSKKGVEILPFGDKKWYNKTVRDALFFKGFRDFRNGLKPT
jgi:hypothetical protein